MAGSCFPSCGYALGKRPDSRSQGGHTAAVATVYYTACSLDGYIATADHGLDWLLTRDIDPVGPQAYGAFIAEVGALVMGANTYQWLLDHLEESWPYHQPCWVMTHRAMPAAGDSVRFSASDPTVVHAEALASAGGRHVWLVGGGELVGSFHDAGLLDEVHVQYAPAILGSGRPLLPRRIDLDLVELDRNRDFACARYRVRRGATTPASE